MENLPSDVLSNVADFTESQILILLESNKKFRSMKDYDDIKSSFDKQKRSHVREKLVSFIESEIDNIGVIGLNIITIMFVLEILFDTSEEKAKAKTKGKGKDKGKGKYKYKKGDNCWENG